MTRFLLLFTIGASWLPRALAVPVDCKSELDARYAAVGRMIIDKIQHDLESPDDTTVRNALSILNHLPLESFTDLIQPALTSALKLAVESADHGPAAALAYLRLTMPDAWSEYVSFSDVKALGLERKMKFLTDLGHALKNRPMRTTARLLEVQVLDDRKWRVRIRLDFFRVSAAIYFGKPVVYGEDHVRAIGFDPDIASHGMDVNFEVILNGAPYASVPLTLTPEINGFHYPRIHLLVPVPKRPAF